MAKKHDRQVGVVRLKQNLLKNHFKEEKSAKELLSS